MIPSEDIRLEQLRSALEDSSTKIRLKNEIGHFNNQVKYFDSARSHILEPLFEEQVLDELDQPLICTCDDFINAVFSHLFTDDGYDESGYDGFVEGLLSSVREVHISEHIATLTCCVVDTIPPGEAWDNPLWEDADESFEVTVQGGTGYDTLQPQTLYVRLRGYCSLRAFSCFRDECSDLLRTLFDGFEALERSKGDPKTMYVDKSWAIRLAIKTEDHYRLTGTFSHIGPCLDAFYSKPTKKDSIDRRIRNCLHLLVHSSKQANHAVGISLAVAAIEALLGEKRSDISTTLARHAATILEPDNSSLRPAAVKFMKSIYDARSRLLHGEKMEGSRTRREQAILVALAVLVGFLERRVFLRHAGIEPETPSELFSELADVSFAPGQLTGVSLSPVRQFWGGDYPKPQFAPP